MKGKAILSLFLFLTCSFTTYAQEAINIQDVAELQWYGNDHFQFSAIEDQALEVSINKFPWESFTLDLGEINIFEYPKVTIELSSNKTLPLRIDLYDTQQEYPLTQSIDFANERLSLTYDYSQAFEQIDESKPLYLLFYAAPGENFTGKIQIHSILFEALTTDIEDVDPTTEIAKNYTLRAYPNPTKDIFHIDMPLHPMQLLHLYNPAGQAVFSQDVSQNAGDRIDIEVGYFLPGNYILQLEGDGVSYSQQVVIQ